METKINKFALDTSSRFYSIIKTRKAESLFRYSIVLKDEVSPQILDSAANRALSRFPTMSVSLKAGYAWHYLKHNNKHLPIFEYDGSVKPPINRKINNGHNLRIAYKGNLVVIDFFHALCDGRGALEYIKLLFAIYAQEKGYSPILDGIKSEKDEATEGEKENAFHNIYSPIKLSEIKLKELLGEKPLLIKGTLLKDYVLDSVYIDTNKLKEICKERNTTFTGFVGGLLIYSIVKTRDKYDSRKSIVMMVPVDLRTYFPSETVRNFVHFIRVCIKPKPEYTLDDYIKMTTEQLKEKITEENIKEMIKTTVKSEKSLILKISPLFLKIALTKFLRLFFKSRQTIIFSNVGRVSLDETFGIDAVTMSLNASNNSTVNLATTTANGQTVFTFTRSIRESAIPYKVFNMLESFGCEITKLELSNKEE